MKRTIIIALVLLVAAGQAFAQKEYKLAKSSGKLVINNISNLSVEGYDGKEIIISSAGKKEVVDPRAEGLTVLGNSGFDNTGIGLTISQKDQIAELIAVDRSNFLKVSIKLPYGVDLSIKTSGITDNNDPIVLSNLKSEIDASTQYENIKLLNITGPVSIKTLHGNIESTLSPSFKGPISLVSVYGFVDVKVPENAKADMSISTVFETLYAAKDLKFEITETTQNKETSGPKTVVTYNTKGDGQDVQVIALTGSAQAPAAPKAKPATTTEPSTNVNVAVGQGVTTSDRAEAGRKRATSLINSDFTYTYSGNALFSGGSRGTSITGKLNGGGEKIILKSTHGKIYLRK